MINLSYVTASVGQIFIQQALCQYFVHTVAFTTGSNPLTV